MVSIRRGMHCIGPLLAAWLAACASPPPLTPQPVAWPEERDPDRSAQRRAWMESLHRAAPGDDWRAIDAATLAAQLDRRMALRADALARGATTAADWWTVDLGRGVSGSWRERGSRNQAGRMVGTDYDAASGRLLAYAHGGQVWRAQRTALDWASVNDAAQFVPNGSGGSLLRLPGAPERLLVASDRPNGLYRSDDLGVTWQAASGFPATNTWYARGLARRGSADEVYLVRHYFDTGANTWRPRLFASGDRGGSFADRGFVGTRDQVALFAPRYDSAEVYLLDGVTLSRIAPGTHAVQTLSTVPLGEPIGNRQALLTGGVAGGQTFLYALYSTGGGGTSGNARVLRSLDGGLTWQVRANAPTGAFSFNSAASSTSNADKVFIGGVNTYRSLDGGASWQLVNDWAAYYGSPATQLHADIPAIDVFREPGGGERIFISTDGGTYESTNDLLTVTNLALGNLNVSQYYGSYTRRTPPHHVHAGAQDQGFQKNLAPSATGVLDFNQTISGDYAHLVSGDGGTTLWSVYPGFALLDLNAGTLGQGNLRFWNYTPAGFSGWLFLAPLAVDPLNPLAVYVAGGRLGAGSSHRIVRVQWTGSAFTATQSSHDFGSAVTAIAVDPLDTQRHYAVTSARQFVRSLDGGATWANTGSNLPANHFFWGQRILPHPTVSGRVFVAGSGYSNPGVFVSQDAGATFAPFATGLPATLVFDLAISADGQHLFAATEVGAYYYDTGDATWRDLTALGGPAQTFWHVDYVDALGTARFSTYGRGLWDFVLGNDVIFANGFQP